MPACVHVHHVYTVLSEAIEGSRSPGTRIRQLLTAVWVLGIKPLCTTKGGTVPTYWTFSPLPFLLEHLYFCFWELSVHFISPLKNLICYLTTSYMYVMYLDYSYPTLFKLLVTCLLWPLQIPFPCSIFCFVWWVQKLFRAVWVIMGVELSMGSWWAHHRCTTEIISLRINQ